MNLELIGFKLKDGNFTDIEAVEALKLYAEEGEPIPVELAPYLLEACNALIEKRGNGARTTKTRLKWSSMVWDVRLLHRIGMTVDDACELIAEQNNVAYSSLRDHYKGTKHKAAKDDADMVFEATPEGWS